MVLARRDRVLLALDQVIDGERGRDHHRSGQMCWAKASSAAAFP
jgi:hypothetical protein